MVSNKLIVLVGSIAVSIAVVFTVAPPDPMTQALIAAPVVGVILGSFLVYERFVSNRDVSDSL